MLEKEGFLEYMAKMIWNMASRSLDDLRSNTMLVAHCLGAMKTVAGLMLSDTASERYKIICMKVKIICAWIGYLLIGYFVTSTLDRAILWKFGAK